MHLVVYDFNYFDVAYRHRAIWVSPLNTRSGNSVLFIKDLFSKYDQIRIILWIWSHVLKKFLMQNFIVYAVCVRPRVPSISKL